MKKIVCAVIILMSVVTTNAQFFNSSHVPEAARISFRYQFPKAKHITWTKDEGGYQVRFYDHRKLCFAVYDFQGNTVAEIFEIGKGRLPKRARNHLRESYASFAIQNALMITSPDGKVTYGAHISRAEESYDLVFNSSGYIVSVVPAETAEITAITE